MCFIYNIQPIGGVSVWISPIADVESKTWVLLVYLGTGAITKYRGESRHSETGKGERPHEEAHRKISELFLWKLGSRNIYSQTPSLHYFITSQVHSYPILLDCSGL